MAIRSTQQKFVSLLSCRLAKCGLELVDNPGCANTGTLSIQEPDALAPLGTIGYDFQNGRASFVFGGRIFPRPETEAIGSPSCLVGARQVNENQLDAALDFIVHAAKAESANTPSKPETRCHA